MRVIFARQMWHMSWLDRKHSSISCASRSRCRSAPQSDRGVPTTLPLRVSRTWQTWCSTSVSSCGSSIVPMLSLGTRVRGRRRLSISGLNGQSPYPRQTMLCAEPSGSVKCQRQGYSHIFDSSGHEPGRVGSRLPAVAKAPAGKTRRAKRTMPQVRP